MEEPTTAANVEIMAVEVDRGEGSVPGVDGGEPKNDNVTGANGEGHAEPDPGGLCHWVSPDPRRVHPFMPLERIAMVLASSLPSLTHPSHLPTQV